MFLDVTLTLVVLVELVDDVALPLKAPLKVPAVTVVEAPKVMALAPVQSSLTSKSETPAEAL